MRRYDGRYWRHTGPRYWYCRSLVTSASKSSIRRFVITEKAPTRAFSWLKAATTAFTFKTLLRHDAKWALTPRSLNVKLGLQRKGHKGRAGWLAYTPKQLEALQLAASCANLLPNSDCQTKPHMNNNKLHC